MTPTPEDLAAADALMATSREIADVRVVWLAMARAALAAKEGK